MTLKFRLSMFAIRINNYGMLTVVSIPVKYLVYCISFLLLTFLFSFLGLLLCQDHQSLGFIYALLTDCHSSSTTILVFLEVVQCVRKVTLHQLYLRQCQHASVCPVAYLYQPKEETPCPSVAREFFDERRFAAERSSARNCSASVFVIFIVSVLISAEYTIIVQCAVS